MLQKLTNSKAETDKQNLYEELVGLLSRHEKTIDDIAWVECMDYPSGEQPVRDYIPIVNFVLTAKKTWYDPYEWSIQIPMSLRIYGKYRSFLVEVYEYDGRQNLVYIDMEKMMPEKFKMVESLIVADGDYDYKPIWSKDEQN